MSKTILLIAALLVATVGAGNNGYADDPRAVPVRYGLMIDGREPRFAELACDAAAACRLFDDRESGLKVTLTISSGGDRQDRLSVSCSAQPCGFGTGKSSIDVHHAREQARFEIFSGPDIGTEVLLVLRPRHKIGEVLLQYRLPPAAAKLREKTF